MVTAKRRLLVLSAGIAALVLPAPSSTIRNVCCGPICCIFKQYDNDIAKKGLPRTREMAQGEGAAILNQIARSEGTSGKKGSKGYSDSFGHQLNEDLTSKSLAEIAQIQRRMKKSSAIGRYQFMSETLFGRGGLVERLGLDINTTLFTPELQDRLALELLKQKGYDKWKAGTISDTQFLNGIAGTWAGVSNSTGQSTYAGIGWNRPIKDNRTEMLEAFRKDREATWATSQIMPKGSRSNSKL